MKLTDLLYRVARASADARAARRGPVSYGKRVARRRVYRVTNQATGRLLRAAGLRGRRKW